MLAQQVYHTASPYIISRMRYIIEIYQILCYHQFSKLQLGELIYDYMD